MRVLDSGPEWLSAAQSTDWVGSLKPWQLFVGIGEAAPFSLPSPSSVRQRVTHNAGVFLSNYALVSLFQGAG
jgi:ABC-type nitrate/sulfonate/bicarbonate transport system permease component